MKRFFFVAFGLVEATLFLTMAWLLSMSLPDPSAATFMVLSLIAAASAMYEGFFGALL